LFGNSLTTCHVAGRVDSPQFAPLSETAATRARWGQRPLRNFYITYLYTSTQQGMDFNK
jgi:hypothetical protein